MIVSLKTFLYLGVICAFFFGLALLGETYLQYVLWGIGSLLMVPLLLHGDWHTSMLHRKLFLLWSSFLLVAAASAFYSINIPLSVEGLIFYLFAFLVFYSAATLPKKIPAEVVIVTLLLVSVCIVFESMVLNLKTDWAAMLPGMNLLYSTYGHNHLSAVMVLVIPLSWWAAMHFFSLKNLGWLSKIFIGLPIIFTIALIGSFSRMAIMVGLGQMVVMYVLLRKKTIGGLIKKITGGLLGLTLIALGIKVGLGVYQIADSNFVCPITHLSDQLCKSPLNEQRVHYWIQAGRVLFDHPLLGSGPHTFGIAAKKYNQTPTTGSNFAHNSFLQALSELGLVGGGLYIALMIYMLSGAWRLAQAEIGKKFSWRLAAFISLIGIYTLSLVDFDFSFTTIFSFTMLLLGLLWRELPHQQRLVQTHQLRKRTALFAAALVISVAALFIVVEFLIRTNDYQRAFQTFPFFHWHRKIFEHTITDPKEKTEFMHLYRFHPDVYITTSMTVSGEDERAQLRQQLFKLDPWSRLNASAIPYYIQVGQWQQVDEELRATYSLWQSQRSESEKNMVFTKAHEDQLVDWLMGVANTHVESGQTELAAEYMLMAQFVDEWAIDRHQPSAKILNKSSDLPITFFSTLSQIDPLYFGRYQQAYGEAYLSRLKLSIVEDRELSLIAHVTAIVGLLNNKGYIWNTLSIEYEQLIDSSSSQHAERLTLFTYQWYQLWEYLQTNDLEYEYREKLAEHLSKMGDYSKARAVLNH